MAAIIAAVVGFIFLAWFLRRLFPALFAAVIVVAAPVWLVGGLLLDLLRRPLAFLRPLGVGLARLVGFVLVLPLLPFIFAWSFLAELFRPSRQPSAPVQAAARRTADVIDLAAWRKKNSKIHTSK
jgi:hypothetical protein